MSLADTRQEYDPDPLTPEQLGDDPLAAFATWYDMARGVGTPEPNAMTLSTVGPEGLPDARVVLLKGVEAGRFVWFGNYRSKKGQDLRAHPHAVLSFYWGRIARCVRIAGPVERADAAASDAYFATRPRGSQLGAWASPQSQPVADRDALWQQYHQQQDRFEGQDVPRPEHWGGWALTPTSIEFWKGQPSRMHDRLRFDRADPKAGWRVQRLAP
jgi:pyridoxamine 5'-phosphate oxidase